MDGEEDEEARALVEAEEVEEAEVVVAAAVVVRLLLPLLLFRLAADVGLLPPRPPAPAPAPPSSSKSRKRFFETRPLRVVAVTLPTLLVLPLLPAP